MDAEQEESKTSFLEQLQQQLQQDIEDKAGLGALGDVLVKKPTDCKLLQSSEFKHLKEKLKPLPFLPKAPAPKRVT